MQVPATVADYTVSPAPAAIRAGGSVGMSAGLCDLGWNHARNLLLGPSYYDRYPQDE